RRVLSAGLFEYAAEPVDPPASDVRGDGPHGPLVRRGAELELLVAETADRFDESTVVLAPAVIERRDATPAHSQIVRVEATKVGCPVAQVGERLATQCAHSSFLFSFSRRARASQPRRHRLSRFRRSGS